MAGETQCPHSDLDIHIHNQGFHDSNIHYLEIKARCKICEKPIVFQGLPLGLSPAQPTGELGGYRQTGSDLAVNSLTNKEDPLACWLGTEAIVALATKPRKAGVKVYRGFPCDCCGQ